MNTEFLNEFTYNNNFLHNSEKTRLNNCNSSTKMHIYEFGQLCYVKSMITIHGLHCDEALWAGTRA